MNRLPPRHGLPGPLGDRSRAFRRGFTLLEMIIVLVLIAILAGLAIPSMQSAFSEQAVRGDAHQLALMVKTAMIRSAEQHRSYEIDLTPTSMALHPVGVSAIDPDSTPTTDDDSATAGASMEDILVTSTLNAPNLLLAPDPKKANAWVSIPSDTVWVFEPGELCSAPRIRLARGDAYLEMSFSALTGNVQDETFSFP